MTDHERLENEVYALRRAVKEKTMACRTVEFPSSNKVEKPDSEEWICPVCPVLEAKLADKQMMVDAHLHAWSLLDKFAEKNLGVTHSEIRRHLLLAMETYEKLQAAAREGE